jgi:hypothetical protein
MTQNDISRIMTVRVVDHFEVVNVDHRNGKAPPCGPLLSQSVIELFQDMAAVRQPRQQIGPGHLKRRLMSLTQRLLIVLQRRNIGPNGQNPAIWQNRVIDPEPSAVDQIGLKGFAGHAPAPWQRPGNEGFYVIIIDPDTKPAAVRVAKNASEGEGTLIVSQEHAAVGLVRVPEIVIRIEDRDRLSAFGEGLHEGAERLIVEI